MKTSQFYKNSFDVLNACVLICVCLLFFPFSVTLCNPARQHKSYFWNFDQHLLPFLNIFLRFKGHKNQDYKVDSCFTQTDTHLLSGSEDGSIYFWDLIEAEVVKTIEKAHSSVSYSLSYHPKEACLISASADGAVKVWRPLDWEPEEK